MRTKQESRPSQENAILQHLKGGKPLTQLQAVPLFGCFRLSARIYNLVRKGHPIESEIVTLENGKRVAQYSFLKN